MREIYRQKDFRIVEVVDDMYDLADLKGDMYSMEANPTVSEDILKEQEMEFETRVQEEGVYGYELQRWNPEVGMGWIFEDSCYGFVGQYDPNTDSFNHYIVGEMIDIINEEL